MINRVLKKICFICDLVVMFKNKTFLLLVFCCFFINAQEQIISNPIFPICKLIPEDLIEKCFEETVQDHINQNLVYPQAASEMGLQSIVNVFFEINFEGNVENVKAKSNLVAVEFDDIDALSAANKLFEDAAIEIIDKLPTMIPGKIDGKNATFSFQVPITYRFSNDFANDMIYNLEDVDFPPELKGCKSTNEPKKCFKEKLKLYIDKNIKKQKKSDAEKVIFVEVFVDVNGEIMDFSIIGPESFRKQSEKLIKKIPIVSPAFRKNVPVNFSHSFQIVFN